MMTVAMTIHLNHAKSVKSAPLRRITALITITITIPIPTPIAMATKQFSYYQQSIRARTAPSLPSPHMPCLITSLNCF